MKKFLIVLGLLAVIATGCTSTPATTEVPTTDTTLVVGNVDSLIIVAPIDSCAVDTAAKK